MKVLLYSTFVKHCFNDCMMTISSRDIRPTKLGQKRDEDAEDGEEDNEVLITLTSRNPNDSFAQIW